jgi:PAS domain S-box-containing protein
MNTLPRSLLAVMGVLLVGLTVSGGWFYRTEEARVRRDVQAGLTSIAEMKAGQIGAWRNERIGDGAVLAENPLFAAELARWMAQPDPETAGKIRSAFRALAKHYTFHDVQLLDARGQVRLSISPQPSQPSEATRQAMQEAREQRKPVFADLRPHPEHPVVRGEVVAPLFIGEGSTAEYLGAIILEIDAQQFIYPVTQSWPTPTRTAETLFVRRDGDSVLFLNALRHNPDAALTLRIPLSRTNVPSVMAALGRRGVVEGIDYNGTAVLAALIDIPGSTWLMVTKIETTEALAEWRFRARLIIVVLFLSAGALTGTAVIIWLQRSKYLVLKEMAESLRASEERTRLTIEGVKNYGIMLLDATGRVERWNNGLQRLFGYEAGSIVGQPNSVFFPTEDHVAGKPARLLEQAAQHGQAEDEGWRTRQDGSRFWADVMLTALRDPSGVVTGYAKITHDASERKKNEEISKARMRLLESSTSGTLDHTMQLALDLIEAQTGSTAGFYHFLGADQETLTLQGWSTNTIAHMCTAEGKGSHYSISKAGVWCDCVRTRQPIIHNDYASLPHRQGLPAGHTPMVRELVVPLVRDDKIVAIIGVGNKPTFYDQRDLAIALELGDLSWEIVERKRAEESLRRNRELLDETGDLARVGGWELNLATQKLEWTRATRRIHEVGDDYQPELATGVSFYAPDSVPVISEAVRRAIEGTEPFDLELPLITAKQNHLWVRAIGRAYQEKGRTVRIGGVLHDITARKQQEAELRKLLAELKRSNEELEQFAYIASHDLQEPLRMVASYTQLLAQRYKGRLDQDADDFIGFAVDGATRMQRLINDLLVFSRAGNRGQPLSRIASQEAYDDALRNLTLTINDTGAVVTHDPLPSLHADAGQLVQLFQNLVGNAIKFHQPDVPPHVHVTARLAADEWIFSVADNGIGIAPQYHERIFVIFQRLHSRRKYSGTGIGLALCRRIVERHQGRLWVESAEGRGTTFFFTMPAKS